MEVMTGFKQTEVGVIPETWEVDSLDSVIPRNARNGIVDGPFGSNLKTIHYRKAGIPIITSGYVTEGRFLADNYLYVEKQKFEEEKRSAVQSGDIVMAKIGARCGASAILPDGHPVGILSGNALKITVDETRHSTLYIWHVLWKLYSEGSIDELRTVGAQPAISMANLKRYRIALPPLPEQRAIAAALSDVDALLDGLERLLAKKRDLKQAAMQQLLTGQIRLPGFLGEWNQVCLGEIFTFKNGLNKGKEFFGFGTPIVNYMDVFGNTGIICSKLEGRVSLTKQEINNFNVKKGDVLFTRTSETPEEIGMASVIIDESDETVFSGFVLRGRPKNDVLCDAFKAYCFRSTYVRKQIISKASYTTRALTNGRILSAVTLSVPTRAEQTAIAEVLMDMDAELAALEQRRKKTCLLKQGMMQELLTGRTRLVNSAPSP